MRKFYLLIPSILVSTIPMVSMVGCNDKDNGPSSIKITNKPSSLEFDEPCKLEYEFTPSSYKGKVEWSSSNNVVNISDDGTITTNDIGSTIISVTAVGYPKIEDHFELNVKPTITITNKTGTINIDEELQLEYSCAPSSYQPERLIWHSQDPQFVSVSETGLLTPQPGSEKQHTVISVYVKNDASINDSFWIEVVE